jgi:hypothetical protein
VAEPQTQDPPDLEPPRIRAITALRGEFGNPLFRNAYALMINGGLTGLLGLAYWFLAARFYDPAQVGQESAQNQAMMFLGSLTALNLILIRFVPEMGPRTGALVRRAYLAVAIAAVTTAAGFLFTVGWWGPSFARLSGPGPGTWFAVSVVGWALYTTQDGVLTGLRRATWVLGKNTIFAACKIVLLVALATVLPDYGITASWVISALILLIPFEVLIVRRFIPAHVAAAVTDRPIPSGGQIGRYLAGDYTGTLCYAAMINLVPVLVAARLDPSTNAFFYMAWVLGASVDVLAVNMTMSLTVEGSFDSVGLAAACRSVMRRMAVILVPIVVILLLGAHLGLSVFGPGYAAHGTLLLRLLALAIIPKALVELYIGVLRVQRRTRMVALVQALRFLSVLGLVLVLTGRENIAGPGMAVLAASVAAALGILPALLRLATTPPSDTPVATAPAEKPAPAAKPAAAEKPTAAVKPTAARPAATKTRKTEHLPLIGIVTMFVAGLALFWLPLTGVHYGRMNGYGLISVLPVGTLAGAGLLTVAFMVSLGLRRPYRLLLGLQLVAIVLALHGVAPALESYARDPTAWQHAGFIEYITRTGTVDVGLDARFSWPGFFAVMGFLTQAAGIHNLEPILRWATVANQLLYLIPLYLILRVMRASWRAKWMSAWLFMVADWVGQDYFSPQAFGMLLYLFFVGIMLNWFRPDHGPNIYVHRKGRIRTFLVGPMGVGERTPAPVSLAERSILLLLLIVLYAVTTASHQLTPYLMLFACVAFILVRRCDLRGLPILLGVITVVWVNFMTTAYWAHNLNNLFSGLGQLLSNVTAGTSGRISNGSVELAQVQEARVLIAGTIVMLAVFGALRRRFRRIDDRVALILLGMPFLSLGLQSYGGEIAMRVYFFILPGACILLGYLFFPTTFAATRVWRSVCAATLCGLVLAGGFLFVRFGNEPSEEVQPGDVQAISSTLHASPTGPINIVWLTDPANAVGYFPQMPWGYREMERFDYTAVLPAASPTNLSGILQALGQTPGRYFITTRVHEAYLRDSYGVPQTYLNRFRTALAASTLLRPVFNDGEAVVYTLKKQPAGPAPIAHVRQPFTFGKTPWTPVGLVIVPLLLVVLAARELRRLRALPGEDRLPLPRWLRTRLPGVPLYVGVTARPLRTYTLIAIPLLIALAAIVVERFAVLG